MSDLPGDRELSDYRSKRDLEATPEPPGTTMGAGDRPIFVIQQHEASTDHWDFRLEVGGVLKSWAVPKGPSTDPRDKRLAIPTEDHPLEYADFEGVIPEDKYGGGTVLVWDRGPYRNLRADKEGDSASLEKSLDEGKIEVWLDGTKLEGGYALVRTESGEEERWLLIKIDDEAADARRKPTSTESRSVVSDREMDEIAGKEGNGS
jgi:DNA ligase D-like protein (predicted 3'-phosphoesterase)